MPRVAELSLSGAAGAIGPAGGGGESSSARALNAAASKTTIVTGHTHFMAR
jgi:hypothetical protein